VPNASVFVAGRSTPGWSCDPGPGAGSRCTFPLGGLAAGDHRVVTFAVRVLEGTPEGFELFNDASLEIPDRDANATSRVRRIVAEWGQRCRDYPENSSKFACVTSWGGQGCACLFGICD